MPEATTMTKAELLAHLRDERPNWEQALAAMGEARMTEPGAMGDWSARDVMVHVAFYEQWTADQLEAMARGATEMVVRSELPPETQQDDMDARNAAVHEHYRTMPPAEALTWERREYARLLALVEGLAEGDVNETRRYAWWTFGLPVWQAIRGNSYEHYAEHAAGILAWLGQGRV